MANRNVNQTTLLGNVTKTPELNHTAGGTAVTNFTIATNSQRKDNESGEYVEHAQYHRCTAWGRLAEIVCEWVKAGQMVYAQGELNYGKYERTLESGDVVEWPTTEITVRELIMVGGRPQGNAAPADEGAVDEEFVPDDDLPF